MAQKKEKGEKFYLYDSKWEPAKAENAVYLVTDKKINDTTLTRMVYHFTGPLIRVETYKNAESDVLHGYLAFFGDDGNIHSSGYAFEGKKDSTWYTYNDTLAIVWQNDYKKGVLVNAIDIAAKRKTDTLKELLPGEKEAGFKGGTASWIKYLQRALEFPDRATKLGIGGTVKVLFIVDADGNTLFPRIIRSIEYTLDKEALKVIADSPQWNPAEQKGKKVKAYRIQPITFTAMKN